MLKSGRAGAHYVHAENIQFVETLSQGPQGCFKAKIKIYDTIKKQWIIKDRSSFFPAEWSPGRIEQEILSAWENKTKSSKNKWWGMSNSGLTIEGFIQKDGKIFGYPIWD